MFIITSEIGIDAGHRVPQHESKCKNMHGHRYRIIAEPYCHKLKQEGSEQGMVMDFGFVKEEMMDVIHKRCDHTFIWYYKDPMLHSLLGDIDPEVLANVEQNEGQQLYTLKYGMFYLTRFVPTAELLCWHWGNLLIPRIAKRTNHTVRLHRLVVYETPNHSAIHEFKTTYEPGERNYGYI